MKKIITTILIILVLIGIILFVFFNFSTEVEPNVDNQTEIQPEEEVVEEKNNDTEIKLYFCDSTSDILTAETKKVEAKELIDNPYLYVLKLLFDGPTDSKYKVVIPEGTKINNVYLNKGTLYIDLSEEFLNSNGTNSIYSIVETMSQFNEVENVKFTINGQNKEGLNEKYTKNN